MPCKEFPNWQGETRAVAADLEHNQSGFRSEVVGRGGAVNGRQWYDRRWITGDEG